MGRDKLQVWKYYHKSKNAQNVDIVISKFCPKTYEFANATRMRDHLLKCKGCPESIKRSLINISTSGNLKFSLTTRFSLS